MADFTRFQVVPPFSKYDICPYVLKKLIKEKLKVLQFYVFDLHTSCKANSNNDDSFPDMCLM